MAAKNRPTKPRSTRSNRPQPVAAKKVRVKKSAAKRGVSTRVQPKSLAAPRASKSTLARESLNPKSTVKKRSVNHAVASKSRVPGSPGAAPLSNQDPKRRLGNFTGKGEAPRKGYRGKGIVGQQIRPNRGN